MHAQRILPVLDGLDEMDPVTAATGPGPMQRPRAVAVLRALNAGIRAPVVVACRHTDYRDISQAATVPAAAPTILTDARHVTLRPLDEQEIITYLTARFHGRDGQLRPRWRPVADALTKQTPLLGVLANPWQLFLAVTAYTAEHSNPADLLTMSPERVEAHLLANLIPAVVEHNDTAAHHGWTTPDVTRWLGVIAGHQHRTATERGTSETDIYLPELWRIADRSHPRWVPLLALTPPMGLILVLFFSTDTPGWYVAVALIGLATLGFTAFDPRSTMARIDLGGLRTPQGRRRLRTGLAFGLPGWLVGWLVGWLPFGNGSVWLRYAIAVRAAARHGSLPRRPARFLDWCLHTGLMRMAGTAIQFRHRRLQETLTPPDTSRVDSDLSSVPTGPPHPPAYSQE